jgi:hypothetical protein
MKSLAHAYSKIEILETTSKLAWGGEIGLWCLIKTAEEYTETNIEDKKHFNMKKESDTRL